MRILSLALSLIAKKNITNSLPSSITPLRGHASHIVPPSTFKPLEMTYGWSGPYLVSPASNSPPRPGPEGFVMGIGWGVSVSLGLGKPGDFMHQVDDSVVLPGVKECACIHLSVYRYLYIRLI